MARLSSLRRFVLATFVALPAVVAQGPVARAADEQQATFRSTVDLIAVDVQVVDSDGRPVVGLGPGTFEVEINGKRRKVVSADFIDSVAETAGPAGSSTAKPVATPASAGPTATNLWVTSAGTTRTFVIAFDVTSLNTADSRGVVAAARRFIDQLQPNDMVGLYAFPIGPRVDPTLNHVEVKRQLDTIVGQKHSLQSEYNLSPAEVIDINAETVRARGQNQAAPGGNANVNTVTSLTGTETEAIRRVQLRECGGADVRCVESIQTEALALAFTYETQATEILSGLRSMIRTLGDYPGRKTVVMLSGGMVASDRPGGRPDVGDLPKQLGQDAAATNTTIYALHIDTAFPQQYRAETRKTDRPPQNTARESAMLGRTLDLFAGASGGALMPVIMGSGELALNRVLLETSSHYLLGVQPDETDRDGRMRALKVKLVNSKGATIRSRLWVVIPKRKA